MIQGSGLVDAFLANAKVRFARPVDTAALEQLLVHAWESSRAQWPGVVLPPEPFVTHLAQRLPEAGPDSPVSALLEQLSLAELYLACACMRGIAPAIELFERYYLAPLPALLRGPKQCDALIDDVCQLARVKLLVPTPEGGPKISEYTGRGALMSWVRVTAGRINSKLQAGEKLASEQDFDDLVKALPAPGVDPEGDYIKRHHHTDFRHAVGEAFSMLSAEERHLLRLYFVDQLSMYALAALFRVNQSTISRWLATVRQTIYEETWRCLQKRTGSSERDFESFLAGIGSKFDLGLSQLLKEEDGVPRTPKQD